MFFCPQRIYSSTQRRTGNNLFIKYEAPEEWIIDLKNKVDVSGGTRGSIVMEESIKATKHSLAASPSHRSLERRGPCGCFSRDGGTRQQIFQLRALPLITREERSTGCTTGRSWGLACWLSSHAPPTCAASSMSAKSFRTHFSSPDVLPNNIPSKPCSLQNHIWQHASGFLHPVLLTFTVLSTWKTLLVPFVAIMLRPKFHLYFSLFFPTDFPYSVTEVLTPGWKISCPTNHPVNTFICNIWKSYYILFDLCVHMHAFHGACVESEDNLRGQVPSWQVGLGDWTQVVRFGALSLHAHGHLCHFSSTWKVTCWGFWECPFNIKCFEGQGNTFSIFSAPQLPNLFFPRSTKYLLHGFRFIKKTLAKER